MISREERPAAADLDAFGRLGEEQSCNLEYQNKTTDGEFEL